MQLKDAVVIITGASRGIGRATAIAFAREGANVVINYRTDHEGAEQTLQDVATLSKGISIQADVSKKEEIQGMLASTIQTFSRIDILINNAALPSERTDFLNTPYETMEEMTQVNLLGPILCSQCVIPYMQQQGFGKLLFTGSIRGWTEGGRTILYSATKAAIHSVVKTLAKQFAPNILVNAVAPGYVKTRFHADISEEKERQYLTQSYLNRPVFEEDIANAFVFLAKNDAITGQVVYVDCGYTLK